MLQVVWLSMASTSGLSGRGKTGAAAAKKTGAAGTAVVSAAAPASVQYVLVEPPDSSTSVSLESGGLVLKSDPDLPGSTSSARRQVLIRQPSYCKILDDLKGAESTVMVKGETSGGSVEVTSASADQSGGSGGDSSTVQTININGQQYQIVSPSALTPGQVEGLQVATGTSSPAGGSSPAVVQYAATSQNGQTMFVPGTVAAAVANAQVVAGGGSSSSRDSSNGGGSGAPVAEEATRKREVRLMKNREAARECRNKKKEYIKCA